MFGRRSTAAEAQEFDAASPGTSAAGADPQAAAGTGMRVWGARGAGRRRAGEPVSDGGANAGTAGAGGAQPWSTTSMERGSIAAAAPPPQPPLPYQPPTQPAPAPTDRMVVYNNPLSEGGAGAASPSAAPAEGGGSGSTPLLAKTQGKLDAAWQQQSDGGAHDDRIVAYHGYNDQEYLQDTHGHHHHHVVEEPQQQYLYDPDTGMLSRQGQGQGQDGSRVARQYMEDWHTGQFHRLDEAPSCFPCCGRQPPEAPTGGAPRRAGPAPAPMGPAGTLSDFADFAGSHYMQLGLFFQGLCGGLAVAAFMMTYLSALTTHSAFISWYAQLTSAINRWFSTLIALSLVAACSKWGFQVLGGYSPLQQRYRWADGIMRTAYVAAYLSNLLATPLDDQFTAQARSGNSVQSAPLMWQVFNLVRLLCCALGWALACYRISMARQARLYAAKKLAPVEAIRLAAARQGAAGAGQQWGSLGMGSAGRIDSRRDRLPGTVL